MQNKKSSIIKDSMILLVITLVAGCLLGLVYEITKGPIEEQKMKVKLEAYQAIYKDAATLEEDIALMEAAENIKLSDYDTNFANVTVSEVNKAFDANGNHIGYIVVVTTMEGYGGEISMAFGYTLEGKTTGLAMLTINETVGLGAKASEDEFRNQFANKQVTEFSYTKNGASAENEINAISGATITTNAVVNAMNGGIYFLNNTAAELGGSGLE